MKGLLGGLGEEAVCVPGSVRLGVELCARLAGAGGRRGPGRPEHGEEGKESSPATFSLRDFFLSLKILFIYS